MKENSIDLASKKRSILLHSTALIHTKLTRAQSRIVYYGTTIPERKNGMEESVHTDSKLDSL